MRTFFLAAYFILYMIGLGIKGIKLKYLFKYKGEAEANKYIEKIVMNWSKFTIKTMGLDVEVRGKENIKDETYLFVANHQSYFDIPVLLHIVGKPVGFIAKKELEKVPVLRWWMKKFHCILMDRENPREAIKSINEGIDNLNKGYSMAIFPEGTRSKSHEVMDFKKGSLKLATKSGTKVIPVSIDGTFKALEETGTLKRTKVKVTIGEPIDPKDFSREDQNNLSEIIREIIKNNMEE
ncbi:lysophospholipid acyltransferase family protein [Desnuesiella massiliensis]|uniref:lysophospholipid acyltransferase family protein n=1 Tax=Desnuesiella massiliensis TaxID=1650662 RepID=UPI0006E32259|nr:lysophospholipid acyltransferase family protein [Desnuesiella massiliensis]